MKYTTLKLLCFFISLLPIAVSAQIFDPVKWTSESESIGNGEYIISFTATVEKGWWIYSQNIAGDGPIPTKVTIHKNNDIEWNGKADEVGKAEKSHDPNFDMELIKFHDKVTFKTKVKTKKPEVKISADVEFMTCNKERCLPPDTKDFSFNLVEKAAAPSKVDIPKPNQKTDTKTQGSTTNTTTPANNGKTTFTNNNPTTATAATNAKDAKAQNGTTAFDKSSKTSNAASSTPTNAQNGQNNETISASTDNQTAITPPPSAANNNPTANNLGTNALGSNGQEGLLSPVKWTYSQEKIGENEYVAILKATLDAGWNIYSQHIEGDGPVPTSFTFEPNPDIELLSDKLEEVSEHRKEGADPLFDGMNIIKFSDAVEFRQKLRLKNPNTTLKGSLQFMTCDNMKCLPPDTQDFSIAFGNGGTAAAPDQNNTQPTNSEEKTPWGIFVGGFAGGLLALVTPCVFPMIPLTVSLFTKRNKNRRKGIIDALIYALSIIVIYVGLGFIVTAIFGPTALNELATNPWVNIAFFLVFLFFALSFFGYYELTLPNWLVNKSDEAADKGGMFGIFFMAFTLALTSFSCTGPIIGTLLVQAAATGSTTAPLLGMTGFAFALAIPFGIFALFPGLLKNLPKSGGWLNTVKVVLGFIELALALKFLSNADLVKQWGLLKREPFMLIWIGICIATAIYLFGLIKFPHDSPIKKLSGGRIFAGLASLAFGAYLVPGLFCQTPSLISGFPPPITYSYQCGAADVTDSHGAKTKSHCPHGLTCYHDYNEGLAAARKLNKPVFIDFTGWACVNCRKMEETVWNQPDVLPTLSNDYVLISLYVDEKVELPADQQVKYINYKGQEKTFKTVGEKWAHLQTSCYQSNSQPYYVLLDANENMLAAEPIGYTSTENFKTYLNKGVTNYKTGKFEKTLSCAR
jgi:thiol:disulfide interchange protein